MFTDQELFTITISRDKVEIRNGEKNTQTEAQQFSDKETDTLNSIHSVEVR